MTDILRHYLIKKSRQEIGQNQDQSKYQFSAEIFFISKNDSKDFR